MEIMNDSFKISNLKKIVATIQLISGMLLVWWFFTIELFLLTDTRRTIPEPGFMMTMIIIGIVQIIFAWMFLKWNEWITLKV